MLVPQALLTLCNAEHAVLAMVILPCDAFTRLDDSFPDRNGAVIGGADGSSRSPSVA
jgi:hypothetical protein